MPVVYKAQFWSCCCATKGQEKTFSFTPGNAAEAPMGLLRSALPKMVAQIWAKQSSLELLYAHYGLIQEKSIMGMMQWTHTRWCKLLWHPWVKRNKTVGIRTVIYYDLYSFSMQRRFSWGYTKCHCTIPFKMYTLLRLSCMQLTLPVFFLGGYNLFYVLF